MKPNFSTYLMGLVLVALFSGFAHAGDPPTLVVDADYVGDGTPTLQITGVIYDENVPGLTCWAEVTWGGMKFSYPIELDYQVDAAIINDQIGPIPAVDHIVVVALDSEGLTTQVLIDIPF